MMMYLLAIGAPAYNISPASWNAFSRPTMEFENFTYISGADPLFVHQYSHAWFDFRNRRDQYANYFLNSAIATEAHRQFCYSIRWRFRLRFAPRLSGLGWSSRDRTYRWHGCPLRRRRIDSVPAQGDDRVPSQSLQQVWPGSLEAVWICGRLQPSHRLDRC